MHELDLLAIFNSGCESIRRRSTIEQRLFIITNHKYFLLAFNAAKGGQKYFELKDGKVLFTLFRDAYGDVEIILYKPFRYGQRLPRKLKKKLKSL